MTVKSETKKPTPESQLKAYIDKLDSQTQKLFRAVRTAVRKRFPTANELVYDYGTAVVIGYAPAEQGIDAVVAIRGDGKGVSLYFNQGPQLPDPKKLLRGSGKQVRFIQLESARQLAQPDVTALLAATIEFARVALPAEGKGTLIIKSDGAKKKAGSKKLK
jgi:hypothetical protein